PLVSLSTLTQDRVRLRLFNAKPHHARSSSHLPCPLLTHVSCGLRGHSPTCVPPSALVPHAVPSSRCSRRASTTLLPSTPTSTEHLPRHTEHLFRAPLLMPRRC
ncbi:unnamed protein product, partial [Dovyalis caffra]